ncbi:MAG: undecaprenyl-diphosphate phosphatase [Candidatus Nealsonbacteria bacterium]
MWTYVLLGAIQGVFEWIPISSEGIVALFSRFLAKDFNPVDLALFLHLGTLLAVLVYFWRDWLSILTLKNKSLLSFLALSTTFSLIVGYLLYQTVSSLALGNALLLVTGLGLLLTAYLSGHKRVFSLTQTGSAVLIGFLQGLSVVPGLSRSGVTIFGLSLTKRDPRDVLRVSYLMSAPVVLVSGAYLFSNNSALAFEAWPALASSFIVGLATLKFILKSIERVNFTRFAFIFGLLCLLGALITYLI